MKLQRNLHIISVSIRVCEYVCVCVTHDNRSFLKQTKRKSTLIEIYSCRFKIQSVIWVLQKEKAKHSLTFECLQTSQTNSFCIRKVFIFYKYILRIYVCVCMRVCVMITNVIYTDKENSK